MAASSDQQFHLELTRHTLRAIRAVGSSVEFCRECSLDQKAAVDELLASLRPGPRFSATVSIAPQPIHWHRAAGDEAARHRSEAELRACAAALPHGFGRPIEFISCQTDDGAAVCPRGQEPWLLGVTEASALAHEIAAAKQRGLELRRVENATLSQLGATVAVLRSAGQGFVVLWELGLDRSNLFFVSPHGVDAVIACEAGLNAVFAAVQTALGLKFRGAASRLFFNEGYDFTETAPQIAAVVKESLQQALARVPKPESSPAFACIGITDRQEWFTREVARSIGLDPWEPDLAAAITSWSLQLAPGVTPTRSSLGLLHGVAARAAGTTAWHPAWIQPDEPADAPVAAVVANAFAAKPPESGLAPAAPTKEPERAAASAAPVASAPTANVAASAVVEAVAVIEAPPPTAAPEPLDKPTASWRAATEDRRSPPSSDEFEEKVARKRGYGLYASIAAGVVCAAIAAKFYFDAQAATQLAERQKQEAARLAESAEARTRELEQQAKAEAARIRQEAEVAREAAVALARQQAEAQTRHQISAELEAERIAKSPGILIVTTSPVGAAVTIDGVDRGKSPLALNDIPPGRRQVTVILAGHEPVERVVEIRGTQTADLGLIELQRATGTLVINSSPEGIEFALNRVDAIAQSPRSGRTPAQLDDLEPGDYALTFTRAAWPELKQNVTVAKRGTARANARFIGGSVTIASTPSGATVRRDGRVLGTTPLELNDVPPQAVGYELVLAGHEPATVSGDVRSGERLRLEVPLLSVDRIALQNEVKIPPQPYETPAPRLGSISANGPKQVNVSLTVWRDGSLRDVTASGTNDKDLAKRCVEAVAKWKFHPGRGHDDRPLNVRVTLPIMISQES